MTSATATGTVYMVHSIVGLGTEEFEFFSAAPEFQPTRDQRIYVGNVDGGDSLQITADYLLVIPPRFVETDGVLTVDLPSGRQARLEPRGSEAEWVDCNVGEPIERRVQDRLNDELARSEIEVYGDDEPDDVCDGEPRW